MPLATNTLRHKYVCSQHFEAISKCINGILLLYLFLWANYQLIGINIGSVDNR